MISLKKSAPCVPFGTFKGVQYVLLVSVLLVSCRQDKEWADATGARKARSVGKWFEDTWIGEPWGAITLRSTTADSVRGISTDGQWQIRGTVVRHRIDAEIRGDNEIEARTGYLYLIPDTDSLYVGIRAPDGSWERFFAVTRKTGGA